MSPPNDIAYYNACDSKNSTRRLELDVPRAADYDDDDNDDVCGGAVGEKNFVVGSSTGGGFGGGYYYNYGSNLLKKYRSKRRSGKLQQRNSRLRRPGIATKQNQMRVRCV